MLLYVNILEKIINNLKGTISLLISVIGVIAIAYYIINTKFKLFSSIMTFILIALLSYLVLNPSEVQEIGKILFKIIESGGGAI